MNSRPIIPLVFLVTFSGVLILRAGDDEQRVRLPTSIAALALPAPVNARPVASQRVLGEPSPEGSSAVSGAGAVWPNTEVVNQLRDVDANAASVRAAIDKARPVLATDQDVQLLVGALIISHGDLIDGLAWELLACMDCTQTDERIGWGCAADGLCDPNLAYIDVLKRDFGEQAVADALVRMELIQTAIDHRWPLAPFTVIDEARFSESAPR